MSSLHDRLCSGDFSEHDRIELLDEVELDGSVVVRVRTAAGDALLERSLLTEKERQAAVASFEARLRALRFAEPLAAVQLYRRLSGHSPEATTVEAALSRSAPQRQAR